MKVGKELSTPVDDKASFLLTYPLLRMPLHVLINIIPSKSHLHYIYGVRLYLHAEWKTAQSRKLSRA